MKPSNPVLWEIWRPKTKLWTPEDGPWLGPRELVERVQGHNLRTLAGADWQAGQMSGAAADKRATWIALTADTTQTINDAQTSLTGEETTNGLARSTSAGTFTHAGGGATLYTVARTFTYTGGSPIVLTRSALFAASAGAPMVFFAAFGATATLVAQDQVTTSWQINI